VIFSGVSAERCNTKTPVRLASMMARQSSTKLFAWVEEYLGSYCARLLRRGFGESDG
jgi:hypothetical protein